MAEVAMQYNEGTARSWSPLPTTSTPRSGMHEEGFKAGPDQRPERLWRKIKLLKDDEKVSGEDCREGLTCVISVKLTEAQFEGQTKSKLGNSEIRTW